MIKEAIQKISDMRDAAKTEIIDLHGLKYFQKPSGVELVSPPLAGSVHVHSIDAIAEYLESPDAPDTDQLFIVVANHRRVDLIQRRDPEERRAEMVTAGLDRESFPFNQYMDIESFIIKVQTGFADSPEKSEVMKLVSGVRGDVIQKNTDDGISQKVSVEDKLERLDVQAVKPMWDLRPYRTFVEVVQPISPFLLRLKKDKNGNPCAALFEADCSGWKYDAICTIKEYLRSLPAISAAKITVIG
jgi:hypothetical protein